MTKVTDDYLRLARAVSISSASLPPVVVKRKDDWRPSEILSTTSSMSIG